MVKRGDKIRILNRDGQYGQWANRTWIVDHIATNEKEHPGYDKGIGGKLVSERNLPVSLYEWEFEVVKSKGLSKKKLKKVM